MPRDYLVYLEDILNAIQKIEGYVSGMSIDDLMEDQQARDAVIFNLIVIGEAVKSLSTEVKGRQGSVPWSAIAQFRDKITHQYFNINIHIVWDVVQNQLPRLKEAVEALIGSEGQ